MTRPMVAAALLAMVLAGCSDPPSQGMVTDKAHSPAYFTTNYYACGKSMCPTMQYHPEWFSLGVVDPDQKGHSFAVAKATYDACRVGDRWEFHKYTDDRGKTQSESRCSS